MPNASSELVAACVAAIVAVAIIRRAQGRKHGRRFAKMLGGVIDPTTRAALDRHRWLQLRHAIVPGGVDVHKLEAAFDEIRSAFAPQQVDYSNTAYAKNHWKLSCFMEYTNGVAAGGIDLAAGQRMYRACADILQDCDACFLKWYDQLHPRARDSTRTLVRMQSFVTRYLPTPDESHLPRHIDGADVDGSLVLGFPTYSEFGDSGGLTVWDGEDDAEVFRYPVAAGEVCLLDSRVWHQSNPITHGERWVLVIFYQVKTVRPDGRPVLLGKSKLNAKGAAAGSSDAQGGNQGNTKVRELLARRIKDAAKRKAQAEGRGADATADPASWQA